MDEDSRFGTVMIVITATSNASKSLVHVGFCEESVAPNKMDLASIREIFVVQVVPCP